MWKWLLHRITGQCELLRIQYREDNSPRVSRTESSLTRSKFPECNAAVRPNGQDQVEIIAGIIRIKQISEEKHPLFRPQFKECIDRIETYRLLQAELEKRRIAQYDDVSDQETLYELWNTLKPDTPLVSRKTKQWGDIGFQGEDPASDFRGMGMLGLENLVYFAVNHTDIARQTVSNSNHPKYGYSFAIVGINITSLLISLYKSGVLKPHFYKLEKFTPDVNTFNDLYCYVFVQFNKLWMAEKPNVMQFNEIRDKYETILREELLQSNTRLQLAQTAAQVTAL